MTSPNEPETVSESLKDVKGSVKTETVYPESMDVPDQSYGQYQNNLDANIAIRNLPTGKYYSVAFNTTANGSQNITGVGFLPSRIAISVYTISSMSTGTYSNGANRCIYNYGFWGSVGTFNGKIFVAAAWMDGEITALLNDGFTININNPWLAPLQFLVECFG